MKESYENQVLKKQVEIAVNNLRRMSNNETDQSKKLDIDYVITVLTDKPYGSMPF